MHFAPLKYRSTSACDGLKTLWWNKILKNINSVDADRAVFPELFLTFLIITHTKVASENNEQRFDFSTNSLVFHYEIHLTWPNHLFSLIKVIHRYSKTWLLLCFTDEGCFLTIIFYVNLVRSSSILCRSVMVTCSIETRMWASKYLSRKFLKSYQLQSKYLTTSWLTC